MSIKTDDTEADRATGAVASDSANVGRPLRKGGVRSFLPKSRAARALALLALLGFWEIAALAFNHPQLFPTVEQTVVALWKNFASGEFSNAIGQSLVRILYGFFLGSGLGLLIGLGMGYFSVVRRALEPYVHFFRFVTPVAWVSVAAVWFGAGAPSVVFLIFYATIFMVLVNTMAGVLQVEPQRLRMARGFDASRWAMLSRIILPSTVPFIFSGMRIGMSNAFTTAIGGEMLTNTFGIGNIVYRATAFYDGSVMFAGIVVIGSLGFLVDWLFTLGFLRLFKRYVGNS